MALKQVILLNSTDRTHYNASMIADACRAAVGAAMLVLEKDVKEGIDVVMQWYTTDKEEIAVLVMESELGLRSLEWLIDQTTGLSSYLVVGEDGMAKALGVGPADSSTLDEIVGNLEKL
jgi:peptidyl-tRNA hydrolase